MDEQKWLYCDVYNVSCGKNFSRDDSLCSMLFLDNFKSDEEHIDDNGRLVLAGDAKYIIDWEEK